MSFNTLPNLANALDKPDRPRTTYTLTEAETARVIVNSGSWDECMDYAYGNTGTFYMYNDVIGTQTVINHA